jgi:hypothetical protein
MAATPRDAAVPAAGGWRTSKNKRQWLTVERQWLLLPAVVSWCEA